MIDHTRHIGIFNVRDIDIALIGAGGIGAITAVTLGKMGIPRMWAYDPDTVDDINIATQFYRRSDVGLKKVYALQEIIREYTDTKFYPIPLQVDEDYPIMAQQLFISTVDSIASRKQIWKAINKRTCTMGDNWLKDMWYMDARMGAEVFELFVVNLGNPKWYKDHINKADDADIPEVPCTEKATIYTANIAAGHIGATIRRIKTRKQTPGFLQHNIFNQKLSFLEMKQ